MVIKSKAKVLDISGTKTKKRRVVDDEVPVVKKKSTALAVMEEKPKTRISKLNTKGMRSIVGDSAEQIQQLLEQNQNESAVSLMQKRLLQSLVDVLPYAEHAIRKTKGTRGVYQLNSLITSVRELMIDLQSTKDKGALGDAMVEKVIRPLFLDLGMMIVQEEQALASAIKDHVPPEVFKQVRAEQRASTVRVAQGINKAYEQAKQGAVSFMQG